MADVKGSTNTNSLTFMHSYFDRKWNVFCVVTDANGTQVASNVGFIVDSLKDEPKRGILYENPQNVIGNVGDVVEFTIKCDSKYAPSTAWHYSTENTLIPHYVWDYAKITGNDWYIGTKNDGDTRTIQIRVEEWMLEEQTQFRGSALATYVGGEGHRWAMHYNEHPCYSTNARIISPEHPYFTLNPMSQTAALGEYAVFDVQVGGGDGPYTVTWQRRIPGSDEYNYNSNIAVENDTWVDISSYTLDDCKTSYRVKVTEDNKDMTLRCVITDKNGKTVESYPAAICLK